MKCPYRIITKQTPKRKGAEPETVQEFADCYGGECPFHAPEYKYGQLTRPEHCMRVHLENGGVRKE